MQEAFPVTVEDCRLLLEKLRRAQQQVAEIEGIRAFQFRLVEVVHVRHALGPDVAPVIVDGIDAAVLRLIDQACRGAGTEDLVADIEFAQALLEQPFLILVIVDGEVGGETDRRGFPPQDAHAGGVERRHPGRFRVSQQVSQAGAKLSGCLVRERDRQDAPRRHTTCTDQVCHPVGECSGLTGTGARQDEQGSFSV